MLLVHWADAYCKLGYRQASFELLKQLMVWEVENREELPLAPLLNKVLPVVCTEEEASDLIWERKKYLIQAKGRRRAAVNRQAPDYPTPGQPREQTQQPTLPQPEDFLPMQIREITEFLRKNLLLQAQYNQRVKAHYSPPSEEIPKPIPLAGFRDLILIRQALEHEQ